MKKVILTFLVFFYGCKHTNKIMDDDVNFYKKQNDSLKLEIVELKEELKEYKQEIKFFKDELQFRESEISYWGHKYDSLKFIMKK